jgi:hypothetical protein
MRSRSQITQRHYETRLADGTKVTVHGVKGANGEWDLSMYTNGHWHRIGYAWKAGAGWDMDLPSNQTIHARTLTQLIKCAVEFNRGQRHDESA